MVIVGELPLLPPTERISSVTTHRVASSEEREVIQWQIWINPGLRDARWKEIVSGPSDTVIRTSCCASCLLCRGTFMTEHDWPGTVRDKTSHLSENRGVCSLSVYVLLTQEVEKFICLWRVPHGHRWVRPAQEVDATLTSRHKVTSLTPVDGSWVWSGSNITSSPMFARESRLIWARVTS